MRPRMCFQSQPARQKDVPPPPRVEAKGQALHPPSWLLDVSPSPPPPPRGLSSPSCLSASYKDTLVLIGPWTGAHPAPA